MSKPVCVVWHNDVNVYADALARAGLADKIEFHGVKLDETIPEALAQRAEALLAWRPAGALKRLPRLRWIQAVTAGCDYWLNDAELRPEVTLCCARGSHRVQMPENILGALFHLTKPYMHCELEQRESRWTRRTSTPLAGKTLGILGLGAIGQELARKAVALELRVIGTKRTPMPLPNVDKVYAQAQTDQVLREADFVLLLLPATADTENFINAERLSAMKPSAWLLNFARGALIVDADLIAAVKAKKIAGAILDVFRQEPLPATHPFWTTPGIKVLPHIGGGHPERSAGVAEIYVENMRRFVAGEPLKAVVDRALGY
jgi:glyoxylate/hydroxypyruvate reductase A